MAVRAIFWRGLIDQDQLVQHLALRYMALFATHVSVASRQRELGSLVVIERGRRPVLVHMAIRALRDPVLGGKLARMRILVAAFAIFWRSLELNFVRAGQRFVALVAGHGPMSSGQWEFRFRMVEAADVHPGTCTVASLAAQRRAVGAFGCHALLEFVLVRISVAGSAGVVLKMERQNLVRSTSQAGFVAVRAWYRHVRPGQGVACLLVLGNGECGAMKVLYGVAFLASILVGRCRELLVMFILVAIRAGRELHLVLGILAGRGVALVASHGGMFSVQRVLRCGVFLHAE